VGLTNRIMCSMPLVRCFRQRPPPDFSCVWRSLATRSARVAGWPVAVELKLFLCVRRLCAVYPSVRECGFPEIEIRTRDCRIHPTQEEDPIEEEEVQTTEREVVASSAVP
jgi:hypothetical protein